MQDIKLLKMYLDTEFIGIISTLRSIPIEHATNVEPYMIQIVKIFKYLIEKNTKEQNFPNKNKNILFQLTNLGKNDNADTTTLEFCDRFSIPEDLDKLQSGYEKHIPSIRTNFDALNDLLFLFRECNNFLQRFVK